MRSVRYAATASALVLMVMAAVTTRGGSQNHSSSVCSSTGLCRPPGSFATEEAFLNAEAVFVPDQSGMSGGAGWVGMSKDGDSDAFMRRERLDSRVQAMVRNLVAAHRNWAQTTVMV